MSDRKSYAQHCAIAKALDRLGDRWTLLILRDLHSGPTRFGDLLDGLPGIASNLLSSRLKQLQDDEIVTRATNEHGVSLYSLTPLGQRTRPILEELGSWGRALAPPARSRRPTSHRALALPLQALITAGLPVPSATRLDLAIDDQHFTIELAPNRATVTRGRPTDGNAALTATYESIAKLLVAGADPISARTAFTFVDGDRAAAASLTSLVERALDKERDWFG